MAGKRNGNKGGGQSSKASSGIAGADKNAAVNGKILLDTLRVPKYAASALSALVQKSTDSNKPLSKQDLTNLEVVINALNRVSTDGTKQAARVSPLPHLIQAYNMATREQREQDKSADPMVLLKSYVKPPSNPSDGKQKKRISSPTIEALSSSKKLRRSVRQSQQVTPEKKKMTDAEVRKLFNGHPPFPDKKWSPQTLCSEMSRLEILIEEGDIDGKEWNMKKFLRNVLSVGKTDYKADSGIYTMFKKYKQSNRLVAPSGRGRKPIMTISAATEAAKKSLKERKGNSSAVLLRAVKNAYEDVLKDQAEKDGLERETVDCGVSNLWQS